MSERLKVHIDELTAKRRGLIAQGEDIARQVETLTIRIDEAKEALALVTNEAEPPRRGEPADTSPEAKAVAWEASLQAFQKRGTRFTTDEIFADVDARNVGLTRAQVRGRLSDLVDKGTLRRRSEGIFEFIGEPRSHVLRAMRQMEREEAG